MKINQSRSLRVGEPVAQMLVTSSETAHPSGKQDLLLNQIALPITEAEGSRERLCTVSSSAELTQKRSLPFKDSMRRQLLLGEVMLASSVPLFSHCGNQALLKLF